MAPKREVVGAVMKATKKVVEESREVSIFTGGKKKASVVTETDTTTRSKEVTEVSILPPPPKSAPEKGKKGAGIKPRGEGREEESQETRIEASREGGGGGGGGKQKRKAGGKRTRGATGGGSRGGSYKRYVRKVLEQVHPGLGASAAAMTVLDGLVGDMFERIVEEAARLRGYSGRATLSSGEVQAAVRLVLPGELGRHAAAEGAKAVARYVDATAGRA